MSTSIETQLLEYRARRRREAFIEATKRKILGMVSLNITQGDTEPLLDDPLMITEGDKINSDDEIEIENMSLVDIIKNNKYKVACFTFWVVIFMMFVHMQWGAVFFTLSAIIFIFVNTRTRSRKFGEVSAYSVFNKDCKTIEGQLTAEQFENELRYGLGTVK